MKIKTEIDIFSIPSSILSIVAICVGLYYFFSGPNISVVPIERVIAYKDRCHYVKEPTLNFVVPVAIYNASRQENVAAISKMRLFIELSDKRFEFSPEMFVSFRPSNDFGNKLSGRTTCERELQNLLYHISEGDKFLPFALPGGGFRSQEILFTPTVGSCPDGGNDCYLRNYMILESVLDLIRISSDSKEVIYFSIYINDKSMSKCEITLNKDIYMALDYYSYFEVFCDK